MYCHLLLLLRKQVKRELDTYMVFRGDNWTAHSQWKSCANNGEQSEHVHKNNNSFNSLSASAWFSLFPCTLTIPSASKHWLMTHSYGLDTLPKWGNSHFIDTFIIYFGKPWFIILLHSLAIIQMRLLRGECLVPEKHKVSCGTTHTQNTALIVTLQVVDQPSPWQHK